MKNGLKQLLLLILLSASTSNLMAQSMNRLSAGLYGGAALNMHQGTLTTNEGVLECGSFENATSLRWFVGNQVNIPIGENWALSPRLYYHKANGSFEASNVVQPLIALRDGSTTTLKTSNTLDVALDYVSLDLLASYFLTERLYACGGLTLGLPTRNAFEQNESILSPSGATFSDGSTVHRIAAGYFTDKSGSIATNNIRIAAVLGLGMMIPLNEQFVINPEVSFQYGFTNIISDASWKVHALRAGAGILYVLGKHKVEDVPPPPPPAPPAPVAVMPIPPPMASLEVNNVEAGGSLGVSAEITLHDHRTLDILPLLPYVFFEGGSSSMLDRYHAIPASATGSFTENELPNDQLAVYHDLLNIVGARMKRYPQSTLTLTGCLDPKDDAGKTALSSARAEAVRSYLKSVWGIADERLILQSRALPEMVSNRNVADGRVENRRVELSTNDDRVLAPVFVRNAKRSVEPQQLRMRPTAMYQGKITSAECRIVDASGTVLSRATNTGNDAADFNTSSLGMQDYRGTKPLTAVFEMTTDSGKTVRSERTIPIRKTFTSSRGNADIVHDTIIERYSMILFNFDRASTIAGSNEQVMRMIRSRVRTTSTVNIEGMTDVIGLPPNNQRLSEARAMAVREDIVSRIKPEKLTTKGLGEVTLFDNTLPEGRFYNRRVFVEIETPILPELDEEGGVQR